MAESQRLPLGGHTMTKRVSSPKSAAKESRVSRPFAIALLGLGMASFGIAPAQFAFGDGPAKQPAREQSVLVASREEPVTTPKSETAASKDALEPTAQSSDRNPELASATESDNKVTQFGEALAKIAQ